MYSKTPKRNENGKVEDGRDEKKKKQKKICEEEEKKRSRRKIRTKKRTKGKPSLI